MFQRLASMVRQLLGGAALVAGSITALQAGGRDGSAADRERGLPLVQQFLPSDYEGHNQTWSAVQDRAGRLYVGNRDAVLTYDGQRWGKIATGGLFIYTLGIDADDRIWVGGVNELGYLDPDGRGGRTYHSLRDKLPAEASAFGTVFYLAVLPHGIYFVTSSGWLRWHDGRFAFTPGSRLTGWAVGNEFVVHERGEALRAFDGGRWRVVTDAPVMHSNWVTLVAPQSDGAWLLGTLTDGFWRLHDGRLAPWPTEVDERLRRNRISSGLALPDGSLWISQRPSGVLVLDRAGRLLHFLDGANGLPGSLASRFFADRSGGLWIGLDRGLARVNWPAHLTRFTQLNGLGYGVVKAIARHAGRLYVGTSEGLFRLVPAAPPANAHFEFIPQVGSNVWSLESSGGELLVATNNAVHTIAADGTIERIATGGSYNYARRLPGAERIVAIGDDQDLSLARRTPAGWSALQRVPGVKGEVRLAAEGRDGSLWLAALGGGLLRVRDAGSATPQVEAIHGGHGLASEKLTGIPALIQSGADVLLLDQGRVFRFDERRDRFVETLDVAARLRLSDTPAASLAPGLDGRLWVRLQGQSDRAGPWQGRQFWRIDPAGAASRLSFEVTETIGENPTFFEERTPDGTVLWLGGSGGLARIELPAGFVPPQEFHARIASIRERSGAPLPLDATPLRRAYADQDLNITFATDRLDGRLLRFVTLVDDDPPSTSANASLDLRALTPGRHRLTVRARDADARESRPATLDLEILPPWWLAWWAFGAYAVAATAGVAGLVRWRSRALRRRNEQLEQTVAVRTAELCAREQQLREARDAADAASRAKSVFLASMSHELRTPLNAILGYAQILRLAAGLGPDARRQLETIQSSGDHLLTMINDVLDLAKIEAGKVELSPQPIALSRLLAHLTEVFEPRAAQKGIAFSLHGETPLPDLVLVDETRLRQVLYNLLGNALKFTERGRIELRVGVASSSSSHLATPDARLASPLVRFAVSDTGIGIAPQAQAEIFDLFHQDAAPALASQGAGLGLAISQRLVRLMGGEITVTSAVGEGSCFSFTLPLPRATPAAPPSVVRLPTSYQGPRRRVLLVDDEPVNRDVLRALLAPLGFELTELDNGEAAVAACAGSLPPDLVLLDLRLRGLDGLAAARQIRALPGGDAVRLIAISASVFPVDRTEALAAGCDDFEPKPFRIETLLATIGRVLGLEWDYAAPAGSRSPLLPDQLPAGWPLPPRAVLQQLAEQSDLGDLAALRATLAATPDAAAFLAALEAHAARAHLAPLREWIAAALRRSAPPSA